MKVLNHILYNENGDQVTYKQTPNIGSGVKDIRFILLHFDAASNDTSAVNWLTTKSSSVSSELHITRSGRVTQMAKFNQITWHAGASEWKGLKGLNKYAIGIEQENQGSKNGIYQDWTEVQIQKCIEVCKALVKAYPSITEILGHEEVATPKGRKDDPGPKFPMERVRREVFGTPESSNKSAVTTTDVNLRTGGSTGFPVIKVLKKGTELTVLSTKDNWSNVKLNDNITTGWVSSQYLKT